MDALQRAAEALGGMAAVARAAGARSDSAPHMWKQRGNVPAEYCPGIERATRAAAAEQGKPELIVTCEDLRPDVPWNVLREQTA
jgi:DNA-binding transcriptional regulator YdaS (Cro superfamily)